MSHRLRGNGRAGGPDANALVPQGPAADDALPPISVVVCTRNRPDDLRACLASLECLDYPRFEVVVVDNAPSAETARGIVARTPFRYEREDRPGLDWARCRGVQVARYDIIAFTDDDVCVDPGWLRGVAKAFRSPAVMGMTGLVLPLELETPAQRLFERYGTGMSRGWEARQFVPERMSWRQLVETQVLGVGANMAFRRRAFELAGEFDTALDAGTVAGGAGDLDMFRRVLRAGGEMRYEPAAIVRHRHRREIPELARQLRANGRSFGVYLIKAMRGSAAERAGAAVYAIVVWLPWLFGRLTRGLAGRHPLPVSLLWAELRGALSCPWAYVATYARDRELRTHPESTPRLRRAADGGR